MRGLFPFNSSCCEIHLLCVVSELRSFKLLQNSQLLILPLDSDHKYQAALCRVAVCCVYVSKGGVSVNGFEVLAWSFVWQT